MTKTKNSSSVFLSLNKAQQLVETKINEKQAVIQDIK